MLWHQGNAIDDRDEKGWFFGHFVQECSPNHSTDIELKFADHKAGDAQPEWQKSVGSSIGILITGEMHVAFRNGVAKLHRQGDYVHWAPNVEHRWRAVLPTRILTIRWPSLGPTPPAESR